MRGRPFAPVNTRAIQAHCVDRSPSLRQTVDERTVLGKELGDSIAADGLDRSNGDLDREVSTNGRNPDHGARDPILDRVAVGQRVRARQSRSR